MTIPDVLDGAFAIMKRRPEDVALLTVAFVVPVQLVVVILMRDVLSADGFLGLGDPTSALSGEDTGEVVGAGATVVSIVGGAVSLALLTGALTALVLGWYDGRTVAPREAAATALRRSPALIGGVVVVHILEAVGLLGMGIGALVMMVFLHLVSPVVVAERLGPFRAVARSWRLTTRRSGPSIAVPLLVALVGAVVQNGFQLVPELLIWVTTDRYDWLARGVGQMAAGLVTAPFTAGVAVLYYLDLRIRTEGLDLDHRARAVLPG